MQQPTQQSDKSRPDYLSPAARAMEPDRDLCRDVARGTSHLRSERTEYLPQHPGEDDPDYNRRLGMAVLFNAMERTVTGLSGMVFRKDPVVGDDVPPKLAAHLEDVDNAGTHIDVFARAIFEDGVEAGHSAILVDAPSVAFSNPDGTPRKPSQAEEAAAGIRPYWIHVRAEQILGWRSLVENGRTRLSQLVIWERHEEADGEFGSASVDRYRVYRRRVIPGQPVVSVEVWRKGADDEAPVIETPATVVTNQTEIPLAVFYAGKKGLLVSRPPLVDLAHTNIAHYQTLADHRYCLHIANVPTPWISGIPKDAKVEFGPNTGIRIPDPQGKAGYLEPSGTSFATNLAQLQQFKADMAAMGLGMLVRETRSAETAEAKRIDKSVEDSALASMARSLQDCLESALGFHANFMRLPSGGSIEVNRDFEDQQLTWQDVDEYSKLVQRDQISIRTMWQKLVEGEYLPADFDPEAEQMRLDAMTPPAPATASGNGSPPVPMGAKA